MSNSVFPTTHVGRLSHLDELDHSWTDPLGSRPSTDAYRSLLERSVHNVVRYQRDCGIDIVCDGELGKLSWYTYLTGRLSGLAASRTADLVGDLARSQDWIDFADYYREDFLQSWMARRWGRVVSQPPLSCVGPIRYVGHAELREDIDNLKSAMAAVGAGRGFMNSVAPGSAQLPNAYYPSDEEYLFALAEALSDEYRTIVSEGLDLQVDDPVLVDDHMAQKGEDRVAKQKRAELRVAALNHALRGIPPEKVRAHICWGSWHGPHSTDLPMRDAIPLLLQMNVGAWSVEAANARHEHEFADWKGVDLGGRSVLPGVIAHATNTVEHPELVAWRIGLWADTVGVGSVIPSTDCGLGDRVHPQIEAAKLKALAEGAEIARRRHRRVSL